jgi:hypothetical protein
MAEQQPPVPTTYRERLAQFKILEEKRFELIEVTLQWSTRPDLRRVPYR